MELLELLEKFSKITKSLNFTHICSVENEQYHTDERTDGQKDRQTDKHDEANFRFCQFCERA